MKDDEQSWYEASEASKKVDLSSDLEDKYRSYEVPFFETQKQNVAAYLLARKFTFVGVTLSGAGAPIFRFAVRPSNEPAKTASAYEKGTAPEVSAKALENAWSRLSFAIREQEHREMLSKG